MDVMTRPCWSLESFLEWEERQPTKYEFDGTRPVAMVGVTEAHAMIQANLITAAMNRLDRSRCRIMGSDLKVQVAGRVRYPDALISCSPPALGRRIAADPVVLFEILGDTTAETDLIEKSADYGGLSSVRRYVILYQTRPAGFLFDRDTGDWVAHLLNGPDAVIRLPEVGIALPLAELYDGVALPPLRDAEPTRA